MAKGRDSAINYLATIGSIPSDQGPIGPSDGFTRPSRRVRKTATAAIVSAAVADPEKAPRGRLMHMKKKEMRSPACTLRYGSGIP